MKRIFKLLLLRTLPILLLTGMAMAQSQSVIPWTYTVDPKKDTKFNTAPYEAWLYKRTTSSGAIQHLPFRMLKPLNYNKVNTYPLVIMLHGRGEAGTDNNFQLLWGGKEHLEARNNGKFPGFVVFPQEPYGAWTNGPNYQPDGSQVGTALSQVWDLVEILVNEYNVDRNRIYIHGLSSGGTGVWASLYYRPDLFAAGLPMSAPGDPTQAYKLAPTPLWLFQGGLDNNPIPAVSQQMIAALRSAGAQNTSVTKYTEYPSVKHTTWINAYADADFFPYMLRQNKAKIKILGFNPIPAGSSVALGIAAYLGAYQWYKDGVPIPGATNFRIDNITAPGSYQVFFKHKPSDANWVASDIVNITNSNGSNTPPTVSFTAPVNNSTFSAPASVKFITSAKDNDGAISKVEFYNGANLVFTDASEPYEYTWSNIAAGNYTITAKAIDNLNGASTTSVSFVVNTLTNQPPVVNITSPTNNSVLAPGAVTVNADASDVDGSITKVEFYKNGVLFGTDSWAPYSYTEYNVPAGSYVFEAKAFDNKGEVKSATVNVTLGSNANKPPVVSLTSPANGASYTTVPATINLTASASDQDGTISKVEFYNGTTLLSTDNSSPFEFTWSGVTAGTYSLSAKAYDNANTSSSSSSANIKVGTSSNNPPTVVVTSPTNGSTFPAGANFLIQASASDADGIEKVEFYIGAVLVGTDTWPPFEYQVWNQPAGTYTIYARGFDKAGQFANSSNVTVTFGGTDYFTLTSTCLTSNQSLGVQLKSNYTVNATNYSWSYSGPSVTITPNGSSATLNAGTNINNGDVCVAVTYTGAPSKVFCKNISRCWNREDEPEASSFVETSSIVIDPVANNYGINATRDIESVVVYTLSGVLVHTSKSIKQGEWYSLAELPVGVYLLNVQYTDGSKDLRQMPKLK